MYNLKWFVVLGFVAIVFCVISLRVKPTRDELLFNDYIKKFNKTYKSNATEYLIRLENFKESLEIIKELNKNRSNNSSALYGLTAYADMSKEEFMEMKLQSNYSIVKSPVKFANYSMKKAHWNYKTDAEGMLKHKLLFTNASLNDIRSKRNTGELSPIVDWRRKYVVGKVNNQGTCGACWAFSVVETVESMNAIKTGSFLPLSVQQAIDCAGNGNYGCEGGDSCALLEWLIKTKTMLTSEKNYPFAYHTQKCKSRIPANGVKVQSSHCYDFAGAEEWLLDLLANHGPVAAAVNALHWQYYLGGIIQFHCSGSYHDVNHVVQIVGYNNTGSVPHYIIRNSWGTEFGDNGYLYIAIGGNVCGIANQISVVNV